MTHERYSIPGADFLNEDTWAEGPDTCPSCGHTVAQKDSRCAQCGQWLERCGGSCTSCASPRCVGGKRTRGR